ncbi:MAG: nitroreductase family protein [Acidiferrobacterales bacterium]|nr:nitroreductase family protein [Acidiferrobacterales bacterium]
MSSSLRSIDEIIRSRKTSKILSTVPLEGGIPEAELAVMMEIAGMAPFHIAVSPEHRNGDATTCLVPWRFYVVPKPACLAIRQYLIEAQDKSKVPDMLAATDTLVQVTWCPDPVDPGFETTERWEYCPSRNNMEHIAASAAAVQNLLLVATQRNIASYWSSGGPLRSESVFQLLNIPQNEVLLGSIFLFKGDTSAEDVEIKPGKMREKKGALNEWCRWVNEINTVTNAN